MIAGFTLGVIAGGLLGVGVFADGNCCAVVIVVVVFCSV